MSDRVEVCLARVYERAMEFDSRDPAALRRLRGPLCFGFRARNRSVFAVFEREFRVIELDVDWNPKCVKTRESDDEK